MKDDSLMRRLRAARPVAAEPGNHAALFARIVAEPETPAAPAFAITKERRWLGVGDVELRPKRDLLQVNRKLSAMGTHEQITIYMATGATPLSGPVNCTPAPGASSPSGPQVTVLLGTDGTEVIGSGQPAGNTGEGTFHLDHCVVTVTPARAMRATRAPVDL